MQRLAAVGLLFTMGIILSGCSTPKPAAMAITERDKETYSDQGASTIKKEERYRVAIYIKQDNIDNGREVAEALDASLTSVISDFAFFQIVERSNLDTLLKDQKLEALSADGDASIEIPQAEYLVAAKVNAARVDEQEYTVHTSDGEETKTAYVASLSVDFRFYEKATKRAIMTKNIERKAPGKYSSEDKAIAQLSVIAQECAKAFAMELGARYAPAARVVEMRGNGKLAKVTMGSNYGLAKGVKVEFYEYVDNSDVIVDATREPSPVGYGIVTESDLSTAWVEILNPGSTFVMRGHYVRITSDQSKGMKGQFIDFLNDHTVR